MTEGLRVLAAAAEELADAAEQYEIARNGHGRVFLTEALRATKRATAFPASGRRAQGFSTDRDVRLFGLRTFPYDIVTATVAGERVVIAVAHQHRRPDYWAARLPDR